MLKFNVYTRETRQVSPVYMFIRIMRKNKKIFGGIIL